MFLLNSCLNLFSAACFQAPLLPKLRGHFAEFLNNASSVGLRILSSSTCVGLRYGPCIRYSGFSRQSIRLLHYCVSLRVRTRNYTRGFANASPSSLAPVFPLPAQPPGLCPHSSDIQGYRNINLLSIGYGSRPLLRSRLPQGRSALP